MIKQKKKLKLGIEDLNGKSMKYLKIIMISLILSLNSCTNRNDFDNILVEEFQKCSSQDNCEVDFSKIMNFEWDTMYYFSLSNSIEDIEKVLGFTYNQWEDIGDRVIFVNKGKIVYQKEWFPIADQPLEGTVFITDLKSFKVNNSDAKFKIYKQGNIFFLEKI